ncbi:eukaryotic translation initiation factor 2 subunit 1 [Salpingoeca rosetta]|uniref:Eukaryotic translation initiation factor 2 subunit 1 n=1 Tax=Salpingoeca rosetta (strain ATCC 50818 / BSB-021) TaxID=946362 RepID=F2UCU6_SALR5|nr:eukaryotic translation initiation factor 2 subunit 1 [Salpingoeca rosetta]EGD74441.1 eukaryotic translation initiation factor 2 subunit 1 [Salpingoeca rosetta]|eukprot:XP_004992698.1 eukaryotic translation initiation factor 2 subunit 1 [Salpingoeca rosetta]
MPPKRCRFYKNKFPELEDVVMVEVKSIAEMGAYVELLEYDGVEGMILLSELSRRRIRSINKLVRVGKTEAVVVLRVDEGRGYIDLSKRRVSPDEVAKCENRYSEAKIVNSILRTVADATGYDLEELYEKTAWKLEEGDKPGSSYQAFKKAIVETPELFDTFGLPENVKEKLVEKVKHRLMPNTVKIRAEVDAQCYAYEGIEAVKSALKAGLEESTDDFKIQINLIAPPTYKIETVALDRKLGIDALNTCIERIRSELEARDGELQVRSEPQAVSDEDEKKLKERMDEAGQEEEEEEEDDEE